MTELDYGNARLRARSRHLFDADGYRTLLSATGIEGLVGLLGQSPYAEGLESSVGIGSELRQIDEAIRRHLSSESRLVVHLYDGHVRDDLRLYEIRWDVRNLHTVLRVLSTPQRDRTSVDLAVAAGHLDEATIQQVVHQVDVRAAIDLLGVWGLPSRSFVDHLRRSMPEFAAAGDISVLEHALDQAFGETVAESESHDSVVVALLNGIVDRINVTTAVRLSGSGARGADWVVPGGSLPPTGVSAAMLADDRTEIAELLSSIVPPPWLGPITAWGQTGDAVALEGELDRLAGEEAVRRFRLGDPLGITVPLGYLELVEIEARNVRLVARAIAHDLPRDAILSELVGVS